MAQPLIDSIKNRSLKNKIFFSVTVVILLISVLIALFTRWILISTLTSELKLRGLGIGYSIAESCRSDLLTEDIPQLTSLIFDARLGARRELVGYVFIIDKQDRILAHTFIRDFPAQIATANRIDPEKDHRIQLMTMDNDKVYDVAVAVNEGIYRIGAVHVGLYKKHIDVLINKLRTTFLGFVSVVILFFFIISHHLAKTITRPIAKLTRVSDEISRGIFDIELKMESGLERSGDKDEVRQLSRSFINMTNRIKESQAKLKESDNKYRSLFASGPNPIFVLDRQSLNILSANPSAEETFGYTREELVGRPFTDLGPFELSADQLLTFSTQPTGRVTSVSSKVQYLKKNGEAIYVNVHACPVHFENKQALIVATTDISEMVEKDSQLIQASKMTTLGEMSAGIAHELNQPLNAIKMGSDFLEMMIEKEMPVTEQQLFQIVREVSSQVDRAEGIIRRLRDFGRKTDFTKEKIFINDPIISVLDIIGRQLRLQNIDVQLQLTENLPAILAHHNRMEQVIFNLLTNARDAINLKEESTLRNNQRTIVIRSYTDNDRVVVCVSDTGIGIDPTVKDQIFEAFFTTKKMGEGMGLGLSITNGIVEDYGGKIQIDSIEGRGTTFHLSFPMVP
ncbi:ATP-binding protein [Desulfosarcina variabilis]|uniref:sensor histidine kinase n=1 Tax=Desulfosarcina variabilis TaxID=2300 RepID=UPI003AFAD13D